MHTRRAIKKGNVSFRTGYIKMDDILEWTRSRLSGSYEEVLEYSNAHYSLPRRWLYGKMLKKFLMTSNVPWRVLAEVSLNAGRFYGMLKIMTY